MINDTEKSLPTEAQHETSRHSREILDRKKNEYRRRIFDEIKRRGGMTCDEVEVVLNLRHQTASCFIRFLTQDRLLQATDERRATRTGRRAIVWKAIEPPAPAPEPEPLPGPAIQPNLFSETEMKKIDRSLYQ